MSADSQDPVQPIPSYLASGKYLSALHLLRQQFISFEQTPLVANLLMWTLNAVDPWDSGWSFVEDHQLRDRREQRLQASLSEEARLVPALDELVEPEGPIVAALADHRVIILMESHRAPETRYFGALAAGAQGGGRNAFCLRDGRAAAAGPVHTQRRVSSG